MSVTITPADIRPGMKIRHSSGRVGVVQTVHRYEREGCVVDHGYSGELTLEHAETGWVSGFAFPADSTVEWIGGVHFGPGDVIRFTIRHDHNGTSETRDALVYSARQYDEGGLSLSYRYASNPNGIAWGCYVQPDDVPFAEILYHDDTADLETRSMLAGEPA